MPALIIALIALMGGGGVAAASQSSLPNDALYPVKILTEEVREAVTLNDNAKAKLHAQYAAERVAEVQKMLDEKGVDAKGLDTALANLKEHADQAAQIIDKERREGKDTKDVAKDVQAKIEKARNDLEDKLASAQERSKSKEEKELLKAKAERVKDDIGDSEDRIGKSDEFKAEAQAAITEARKQGEAANQNGLASSTEFSRYQDFMSKASTSIDKEHWVQARQHAEQAVRALEKAETKAERANATSTKERIDEEDAATGTPERIEKDGHGDASSLDKTQKEGDDEDGGIQKGKSEDHKRNK